MFRSIDSLTLSFTTSSLSTLKKTPEEEKADALLSCLESRVFSEAASLQTLLGCQEKITLSLRAAFCSLKEHFPDKEVLFNADLRTLDVSPINLFSSLKREQKEANFSSLVRIDHLSKFLVSEIDNQRVLWENQQAFESLLSQWIDFVNLMFCSRKPEIKVIKQGQQPSAALSDEEIPSELELEVNDKLSSIEKPKFPSDLFEDYLLKNPSCTLKNFADLTKNVEDLIHPLRTFFTKNGSDSSEGYEEEIEQIRENFLSKSNEFFKVLHAIVKTSFIVSFKINASVENILVNKKFFFNSSHFAKRIKDLKKKKALLLKNRKSNFSSLVKITDALARLQRNQSRMERRSQKRKTVKRRTTHPFPPFFSKPPKKGDLSNISIPFHKGSEWRVEEADDDEDDHSSSFNFGKVRRFNGDSADRKEVRLVPERGPIYVMILNSAKTTLT